jgi:hypothetical protein
LLCFVVILLVSQDAHFTTGILPERCVYFHEVV